MVCIRLQVHFRVHLSHYLEGEHIVASCVDVLPSEGLSEV